VFGVQRGMVTSSPRSKPTRAASNHVLGAHDDLLDVACSIAASHQQASATEWKNTWRRMSPSWLTSVEAEPPGKARELLSSEPNLWVCGTCPWSSMQRLKSRFERPQGVTDYSALSLAVDIC